MAIKEFIVNGEKVYINDEIENGEVSIVNKSEDDLSNTATLEVIHEDDKYGETMTNVFGGENE